MDALLKLIDSKIAYLIYGGLITSLVSHILRRRIQKEIWVRDFDRFECEQLIRIFEDIIIAVESGSKIDEGLINKLTARSMLLRYLDDKTKRDIEGLKELAFKHREAVEKTQRNTSGTSQEEEHCKKGILNLITNIIDDIRSLFAR